MPRSSGDLFVSSDSDSDATVDLTPLNNKKEAEKQRSGAVASVERPMCRYGLKCYRKNPSHFNEYRHPDSLQFNLDGSPAAKRPRSEPVEEHHSKQRASLSSSQSEMSNTETQGVSFSFNQSAAQKGARQKTSLSSSQSGTSKVTRQRTSLASSQSDSGSHLHSTSSSNPQRTDANLKRNSSDDLSRSNSTKGQGCELNKGQEEGRVVKCGAEIVEESMPLCFLLTKVTGIPERFNSSGALDIKDILCPTLGELQRSAQFNYCIDIPWLVAQYPTQFRSRPLLIVHGAQRREKADLDLAASRYSHVRLCQAPLEILYGTHHTKMMLVEYDVGMRVVIHTANLLSGDWYQKTQGVWVSPLFPRLADEVTAGVGGEVKGDSGTGFKKDLLLYLSAYGAQRHLEDWARTIREHDMTAARVHLIGSVPGRHTGERKTQFGHLKLRKVLRDHCCRLVDASWSVIGQFSSVGSLGATAESWLCGELLQSLSTASSLFSRALIQPATMKTKSGASISYNVVKGTTSGPRLQLIFPSSENVRCSLEGYPAGGSIPYSQQTAKKQQYFNTYLHRWKASCRGRSRAAPHIKTYARLSPDNHQLAWFLLTSANMSKAAWGALEKNNSQLMIRSYELGVLFIPKHFGPHSVFRVASQSPDDALKTGTDSSEEEAMLFPVPYDLPPTPYAQQERPWIWDIAYTDRPDCNGNQWSPP